MATDDWDSLPVHALYPTSSSVFRAAETNSIPEPFQLLIICGAHPPTPRGKVAGQLQFPEGPCHSALWLAHNEVQSRTEAQLLLGAPSCFDVELQMTGALQAAVLSDSHCSLAIL